MNLLRGKPETPAILMANHHCHSLSQNEERCNKMGYTVYPILKTNMVNPLNHLSLKSNKSNTKVYGYDWSRFGHTYIHT